jgi:hypothetical protein
MGIDVVKIGSAATTLSIVFLLGIAPLEAQQAERAGSVPSAPNRARRISDPHTGMQWILERDPSNQGGPGRMVLDKDGSCDRTTATAEQNVGFLNASHRRQQPSIAFAPVVIRAGDRLVLEEYRPQVETRLEAVALTSAAAGAEFIARLNFQGTIVHAVALEPGRATLGRALGLPRRP